MDHTLWPPTCACGCRQPAPHGLLPPFASDACRARWVHDMHLAELAVHETNRAQEPETPVATTPAVTAGTPAPQIHRKPRPVPGSWLRRVRTGWSR